MKMRKKKLIWLLKTWVQKHGEVPSKRQWNADVNTPSDIPYRIAFGSWGNALKLCGLTPKDRPHKGRPMGSKNKFYKSISSHGYIHLYKPDHPMSMKNGYVREHRMIAYDCGLLKNRNDDVHHKNGNRKDNSIDNLQVIAKSDHAKLTTPKGIKRPRKDSASCKFCSTLTTSKYGLCRKHYKLEWQRGNIYENPLP